MECKDILDYFAEQAFKLGDGIKSPEKPEVSFESLLEDSLLGSIFEKLVYHFLTQEVFQKCFGVTSSKEIIFKFVKLFNVGVLRFSEDLVSFVFEEKEINLLVWNGKEYILLKEALSNYLKEIKKSTEGNL